MALLINLNLIITYIRYWGNYNKHYIVKIAEENDTISYSDNNEKELPIEASLQYLYQGT